MGDGLVQQGVDLAAVQLDVYVSKDEAVEWWNPEQGPIGTPEGWAFLPSGRAFVTRTVKAAGVFWLAWEPRSRSRKHRRLIGLVAPETTIRAAEQAAVDSESARAARREAGARSRERREARYEQELTATIVEYLAFAPQHQRLADDIAQQAAARAAVVGSGRVGRTRLLSLQDRAALAARAEIRHAYTDYEQQLAPEGGDAVNDDLYRAIKAASHEAVEAFLLDHRAEVPIDPIAVLRGAHAGPGPRVDTARASERRSEAAARTTGRRQT